MIKPILSSWLQRPRGYSISWMNFFAALDEVGRDQIPTGSTATDDDEGLDEKVFSFR
jgi:hypothetical protein